jgi:hypothetical protein
MVSNVKPKVSTIKFRVEVAAHNKLRVSVTDDGPDLVQCQATEQDSGLQNNVNV